MLYFHKTFHEIQRSGLFVHALLELLRKDIRWDSDAAAQMIPETLILDAPRLAKVRDSIDRAVLVSTLIVFLRQVLAKRRVVPAPELLQELKKKLPNCDISGFGGFEC